MWVGERKKGFLFKVLEKRVFLERKQKGFLSVRLEKKCLSKITSNCFRKKKFMLREK